MPASALVTCIRQNRWRSSYARNDYAMWAGLIADERIGGLNAALLEITRLGDSASGTGVGCVMDPNCGQDDSSCR